MMLGAAEQMGREMGDELNHIVLFLSDSRMVIIGAGPKHLIGILLDPRADPAKVAVEAKAIIAAG
jgi:predicted regulator of Ras-like GTPase activity (Roadblock/LC7/MglB family)